MSYDLHLYRLTELPRDLDALLDEDDFEPPSMGSAGELKATLSRFLPGMSWSDGGWGHLEGPDYRIDFHVGEASPVRSLMLNCYGDDAFLSVVAPLCRSQGWQMHDPQTGKFLDLNQPSTEGVDKYERFVKAVADVASRQDAKPVPPKDDVCPGEQASSANGSGGRSSIAEFLSPRSRVEPTDEQRQPVLELLDRLVSGTDAEIADAYAADAKIWFALARDSETESELSLTSVELGAYLEGLSAALRELRATGGAHLRFWLEDVQLGVVGNGVRVACRMCSSLDPTGCVTEYRVGPGPDHRWHVLYQRTLHRA